MNRTILVNDQPLTAPINMAPLFSGIREAQGYKPVMLCGHCEGRGVIPQETKVVNCPKCGGSGKEKPSV